MVRMTLATSLLMLTVVTGLALGSSLTGAEAQKSACGSEIHAITARQHHQVASRSSLNASGVYRTPVRAGLRISDSFLESSVSCL